MTTTGYVWMVTEQALDAANAPEGLLGLRLVNATNEHAHIQDSMYDCLKNDFFNEIVSSSRLYFYIYYCLIFPDMSSHQQFEI